MKKLSHTSVGENSVRFRFVGLSWPLISSEVDYKEKSLISSSYPERRKEMNNVTRLQEEDVFYSMLLSKSGYKKVLPLEQKSLDLLQDIICQLASLQDLVLHGFCGAIANGRPCLLLPQPCLP